MRRISSPSGRGGKRLLLILAAILLLAACGREIRPPAPTDVRFCTAEADRVEGALYYPQPGEALTGDEAAVVTGELIFSGLTGWVTRQPVPSGAYWRSGGGDGPAVGDSSELMDPFSAYWTGDERRLCRIGAWVVFKGAPAADPGKLTLTYRNPRLVDQVLLGRPDGGDRAFFTADYNGAAVPVAGVDVIERPGLDIDHGVVVYLEFPDPAEEAP